MSAFKLKTISPIHIGNGKELLINSEFLFFPKQRVAALIDDKKVLQLIGDENMEQWLTVIKNNGNLLDLLKQRKRDIEPSDIALRIIDLHSSASQYKNNIKEHLNSRGKAYIAGSSIKGAIRTAILNELLLQTADERRLNQAISQFKKPKALAYNDEYLMKMVLGPDANKNSFRFLKIGDAHFNEVKTSVTEIGILNILRHKTDYKKGAEQLVESINPNQVASLAFNISSAAYIKKNKLITDSYFLNSFSTLCKWVNKHYLRMVKNEIEDLENDFKLNHSQYSQIIDELKHIQKLIENAAADEMYLRMGFGMGWTFSTGAWAKDASVLKDDDLYSQVIRKSRPNRNYESMPFPKTRKILKNQQLLGFIKIYK